MSQEIDIKIGRNGITVLFDKITKREREEYGYTEYTFYLRDKQQMRFYTKGYMTKPVIKSNSMTMEIPFIAGNRLERKIQKYLS